MTASMVWRLMFAVCMPYTVNTSKKPRKKMPSRARDWWRSSFFLLSAFLTSHKASMTNTGTSVKEVNLTS